MRSSDLIGRRVRDRAGNDLGVIDDLLTRRDERGHTVVYAALVTPRRRARLLGYERPGIQGPWLLEWLSRRLHPGTREVAWRDIQLD
jgi:PRC-barrel domain